jgi:hypothetical protein
MKQRIFWLILSIFPLFFIIFLFYEFLKKELEINYVSQLDQIFLLLSGAAFLMLSNLIIIQLIKPFYTGMVFIAWSLIKLMLVMGFFALYILPKDLNISNHFIYVLVITYLLYLAYELAFSILLIHSKKK